MRAVRNAPSSVLTIGSSGTRKGNFASLDFSELIKKSPARSPVYPKLTTGMSATHVVIAVDGGQAIASTLNAIQAGISNVERHVMDVKDAVADSRSAIKVEITSLAPANVSLAKPIPVVIQVASDDCLASFFDANVSASGDTPQEAFRNLCDILLAKLELFESLPAERLGPEPTRQLAVLHEFVSRA